MKVKIIENVQKDIRKISKKWFPNEACSLLLGCEKKELIEIKESREDKNAGRTGSSFRMEPKFLIESLDNLQEYKLEHVGFFHSHPNKNAFVSREDKKFMELWGDKVWIIGGTNENGKITEIKAFTWSDGVLELEIDRANRKYL